MSNAVSNSPDFHTLEVAPEAGSPFAAGMTRPTSASIRRSGLLMPKPNASTSKATRPLQSICRSRCSTPQPFEPESMACP